MCRGSLFAVDVACHLFVAVSKSFCCYSASRFVVVGSFFLSPFGSALCFGGCPRLFLVRIAYNHTWFGQLERCCSFAGLLVHHCCPSNPTCTCYWLRCCLCGFRLDYRFGVYAVLCLTLFVSSPSLFGCGLQLMLRMRGLLFLNLVFVWLSLSSLFCFVSGFRLYFCTSLVQRSLFIFLYSFVMVATFHVSVHGIVSSLNASVAAVICKGVDRFRRFVAARSGRCRCVCD